MQVQKVYDGPITPDNLEPAIRPITIRQLVTHTSGARLRHRPVGPDRRGFPQPRRGPRARHPAAGAADFPRHAGATASRPFADRLAEFPLVYQPGTRWSYSMGLDLMGRVIEVASGQPFDRFLQDRVFDPLGMRDTHFHVPRADAGRMTTSYGLHRRGPRPPARSAWRRAGSRRCRAT